MVLHPVNFVNIIHLSQTADLSKLIAARTFRGAMQNSIFINRHSQVRDPGPEGPLVVVIYGPSSYSCIGCLKLDLR